MKPILFIAILFFSTSLIAQTTVSGKVVDKNEQPIPGATIQIVDMSVGTTSDFDGYFILKTELNAPFKIKFSALGFSAYLLNVNSSLTDLVIKLNESASKLDEVVISASRTPERIFESPVSVERFGLKEIRNTASADFYDGLENLKGVDINTNSLTFKSINTRGFATFANSRFMQLVDGMDNSTPALNFPIGNLVGIVETDVLSVELLPGASSALYGANAFNGILFMRSKSPFDFQGISASVKRGITSQEVAGDNSYTDIGIRAAHKFSDYFAVKATFGYLDGTDWVASNETDINDPSRTRENFNYNGINVYGDEVTFNINSAAQSLEALGLLPAGANALVPSVEVSRTGYNERDLTNNEARSIKADWAVHVRPWGNDLELIYQGKVGTGTTIYQGLNRYNISDFTQQQHKLEVKNDNFFLRGYIVSDDAGDSYDMVFTGININRAFKDDVSWFGEYAGAYVQAAQAGASESDAHAIARNTADSGRFEPGSPEFERAFNNSINDPDLATGSKFVDKSKYFHSDFNYNFGHLLDFAEIQIGGSFREYNLNSEGTIYTDFDGSINYSEFGLYTQIQKTVPFSDDTRLKLTGSVRYDKSEFFDGFFSPRFSAGLTVNNNHNFRASVQTGFRNPTTQDLFIGLDAGSAILVGSAPDNLDRYERTYSVSQAGQDQFGQPAEVIQSGRAAYENSYLVSAIGDLVLDDSGLPVVANPDIVQPERIITGELGYRGKINKFVVDVSAYYNSYSDFISTQIVAAPLYGSVSDGSALAAVGEGDFVVYSAYTNSDVDVNSYGATIGLSTKIFGNFDLTGNYTYAKLDFDEEANPGFATNFNTPEHKFKLSFGNEELFKNFGFNVAYRFSDEYFWEASFGNGTVPQYSVVDAQINLRVPSFKSIFKLGGTNLTGQEYFTAFGTGMIGSIFYASWVINP